MKRLLLLRHAKSVPARSRWPISRGRLRSAANEMLGASASVCDKARLAPSEY